MPLDWVDCWGAAKRSGATFASFVGGRGIGKSYGCLKNHVLDYRAGECGKLMYLRMSKTEIDGAGSEAGNPYRRINIDTGWSIKLDRSELGFDIIDDSGEEPERVGVALSLSNFGNLRGVDFSDITHMLFDEFIPADKVQRTAVIKQAGKLFAHAYETVNRNRELLGEPPVKVIFLANAFSLDSDILRVFDLVKIYQHMIDSGQERYTDRERSIYCECIHAGGVSQAKAGTALYKAIKDDTFKDLALSNLFTDSALDAVCKPKLTEYKPLVRVGDYVIYQSPAGAWHVKQGKESCGASYSKLQYAKFAKDYKGPFYNAMMLRSVTFDSADTFYKLRDILNTKPL